MAHPELGHVAKSKQRRMGACPRNRVASAQAPAGQIQANLHVNMTILK